MWVCVRVDMGDLLCICNKITCHWCAAVWKRQCYLCKAEYMYSGGEFAVCSDCERLPPDQRPTPESSVEEFFVLKADIHSALLRIPHAYTVFGKYNFS